MSKKMDTMQIPMMERQAGKFHLRHDALKQKAKAESEEVKQDVPSKRWRTMEVQ